MLGSIIGCLAIFALLANVPANALDSAPPAVTVAYDPKLLAAVAAVVGLFSAIVSAIVGWFTARDTVRSELRKRQSELALKISELVSAKDEDVRRAAMRRFSVGIVKIIAPKGHSEWGQVHFIPMNARVTVGRSEDNDIVLKDNENSLSRWHCGFIADQNSVWIDDYQSLNGTKVSGEKILKSKLLASDDEIELGPYKLHFRAIRPNMILAK